MRFKRLNILSEYKKKQLLLPKAIKFISDEEVAKFKNIVKKSSEHSGIFEYFEQSENVYMPGFFYKEYDEEGEFINVFFRTNIEVPDDYNDHESDNRFSKHLDQLNKQLQTYVDQNNTTNGFIEVNIFTNVGYRWQQNRQRSVDISFVYHMKSS